MGKILMDSATAGLLKERLNNDIKDATINEQNEMVCRLAEEKMKMKSENNKSIEDLELSKKAAEDECVSQQEVAKETIRKLEEAMSQQKQQHCSSTETFRDLLKSMEVKLSVREEELNDTKGKCVLNEEKLDESGKEIIRLTKERECNEVEMEEKMKLISIREKESLEVIRQKDMKSKEQEDSL